MSPDNCGFWATYKQWRDLGAQVRRGERASLIVFWNPRPPTTQKAASDPLWFVQSPSAPVEYEGAVRQATTLPRQRSYHRTESSNRSPSASLPVRDILFPALGGGRNPAECRASWLLIRTTRTSWEAHFRPFSLSLGPTSLTQPNHARFGTDVRVPMNQWVTAPPTRHGFERTSLRRSAPGSNNSVPCQGRRARGGDLKAGQGGIRNFQNFEKLCSTSANLGAGAVPPFCIFTSNPDCVSRFGGAHRKEPASTLVAGGAIEGPGRIIGLHLPMTTGRPVSCRS